MNYKNTSASRDAARGRGRTLSAALERGLGAACLIVFTLLAPVDAGAVASNWLATPACYTANWTDACWSHGVPQTNDSAFFIHDDGANRTITYNSNSVGELSTIRIDNSGFAAAQTVLMLTGGSLESYSQVYGDEWLGGIAQTGGTNTAHGVALGNNAGAGGIYRLMDGDLVTHDLIAGALGTGQIDQSGGTNTVEFFMQLGVLNGGTGQYNLSGGELTALGTSVGRYGTGRFSHSGGTHDVFTMYLGRFAGGLGDYHLEDGATLTAHEVYVGKAGGGLFEQNGGDQTVYATYLPDGSLFRSGILSIGTDAGSSGTYNLNGGALAIEGVIGNGAGTSTLNIDGGTLTLTMMLNGNPAGSIDVDTFRLGNADSSNGSHTLSDGHFLNAAEEVIGRNGTGTFNQLGGTNLVAQTLTIAANPGSSGTYNLQGGTLAAANIQNNGTFNISGGNLNITDPAGAFHNGQEQQSPGIDPNAFLNIDNTVVVINGDVVNYGAIIVTDSNVSFNNGTLTNNGGYVSDPSENFFADLVIGETGYLVGGAGDEFFVSGDLLNFSEQPGLWDTAGAYLGFTGAGPHEFRLADALDPTDFGWGTLELSGGSSLTLTNGTVGLFVAELVLGPGTSLDLNGSDLFVTTLTDNGGSYSGGDIILVTQPVPLPAAWLLMLAGLPLLGWTGRRAAVS